MQALFRSYKLSIGHRHGTRLSDKPTCPNGIGPPHSIQHKKHDVDFLGQKVLGGESFYSGSHSLEHFGGWGAACPHPFGISKRPNLFKGVKSDSAGWFRFLIGLLCVGGGWWTNRVDAISVLSLSSIFWFVFIVVNIVINIYYFNCKQPRVAL